MKKKKIREKKQKQKILEIDIDECASGTDDCSANAECTNTAGSFDCFCNAGFIDEFGDGTECYGKKPIF